MMPTVLPTGIQPVDPSSYPHLTAQMSQLHLSTDVTPAAADQHTGVM